MLTYLANLSAKDGRRFILLFAFISLFFGLGAGELFSGDELRVAGISAQTALEHHYLIPRLNGEPFLEYPPLFYWIESVFFTLFGFNTFAARLTSTLAGLGSAWILYEVALRLKYRPTTAMFASIILLSSAQFFDSSRKNTVDALLMFFILSSVVCSYFLIFAEKIGKKFLFGTMTVLALAGATYTKGPIGIVLPIFVIGIWLILLDIREKKFHFARYFSFGCAVLCACALISVWYICLGYHSPTMLQEALFTNVVGRATGSQGDHTGNTFYYLNRFPTLFQPHLELFLLGLFLILRKIKNINAGKLLFLIYAVIPFFIFQFIAAKRIVYLLPLAAPCALIAADVLEQIPDKWISAYSAFLDGHPIIRKLPVILFVSSFTITFCIFFFLTPGIHKLLSIMGLLCCVMLFHQQKKSKLQLTKLLATVALLYASIAGYNETRTEDDLSGLFHFCKTEETAGKQIILITDTERTMGAAYYYMQHTLQYMHYEHASIIPDAYLLTRERDSKLQGMTFPDYHILIPTQQKQ